MRKNILITGASGNIGRAISHLFYSKGYNLFLLGRNLKKLEEIKDNLIDANKGWIKIVKYDALDKKEDKIMHEILKDCKYIDILINASGIGYYESLEDLDDNITKMVFEVNFFAPVRLTQAFLTQEKRPLWIINILSISSKLPVPFSGIYTASKAALYMEMESARGELEKDIKIINILPGRIESDFSKNAPGTKYFSHGGKRAKAGDLAKVVYNAFLKGKREVIWPQKYRYILWVQKLFPQIYESKIKKLKKEYEKK